MTPVRRIVQDESGMTMGLVVIMIVLLGVMGAGLLTFVSRDLNTVVEENRGQRAFEVADAGIGAAKRQLTADCSDDPNVCNDHYDDPDATGDDIQWSAGKGGLTLEDLDGDGDPTDSVDVTIKSEGADSYKVISTGHYGTAKRRIEAVFKGVQEPASAGGDGLGHPLYYTPSDIKIASMRGTTQDPVSMNKLSLFTEQDIILESPPFSPSNPANTYTSDPTSVHNKTVFKNDFRANSRNSGTVGMKADADELCDWDSANPLLYKPTGNTNFCFKSTDPITGQEVDKTGPWNDVERNQLGSPEGYGHFSTGADMLEGGFGAEGLICGVPQTNFAATNNCPANSSVADGVYAYDCTTGSYAPDDTSKCLDTVSPPRGNQLTFVDKNDELGPGGSERPNSDVDNTAPSRVISYPFARPKPIAKELYKLSVESTLCGADSIPNKKGCSYTGVPTMTAQWQAFWPSTNDSYNPTTGTDKLVFIDARNSATQIQWNVANQTSQPYKGILVVWCGDLLQQSSFNGVILNLQGPGFTYTAPDGTTVDVPGCGPDKGIYKNAGTFGGASNKITCRCWVYANGGTTSRAGIEIGPGSILFYPPGRAWNFLSYAFETENPPPTTFTLQGWRELYE